VDVLKTQNRKKAPCVKQHCCYQFAMQQDMLDMPVYFINYLFRAFKFNMTFCIHKDLFFPRETLKPFFSFTCLTNIIHAPLLHTGGGEEGRGRGGRESKKRKSADGLESKALRSAGRRSTAPQQGSSLSVGGEVQ
jgi:hypothetical protein